MNCQVVTCERVALRDSNRCEDHRLRWTPAAPVERPVEPEWLRRRRTVGIPAKDYSYNGAA